MKCCGLLLSLTLCAGCATTCVRETPRAVRLGTARVETTALVEALRTQVKGTRVQALNGAWRDQVFQAQCVLKGDGETLTVVFLAPQMRLVTIAVTKPHAIRCERAPRIPSAFEPEYALADLAFVNLDAATLRRAVGEAAFETVSIMTGPEGGFSEDEVRLAQEAGMQICTLGPRILRCETAPLCALSAVLYAAGALD